MLIMCATITSHTLLPCDLTLVDLTAALHSTGVATYCEIWNIIFFRSISWLLKQEPQICAGWELICSSWWQPHSQAFYTSRFWSLAVCKNGEGLGNLITWSVAWLLYVITPPFIRQVMYDTIFCASYETNSYSVLATKMAQEPAESYTEHMKPIHAKSNDSKRLVSDKHENAQQWCNHLVEQKDGTIWSCTTYITAIPQQLGFEPGYVLQAGLTSPLVWFSSFSVAVDKNVKEHAHE